MKGKTKGIYQTVGAFLVRVFMEVDMIKSKSLSDILEENKNLSRKIGFEEINNLKAGFDDSEIERTNKEYLNVKEGK